MSRLFVGLDLLGRFHTSEVHVASLGLFAVFGTRRFGVLCSMRKHVLGTLRLKVNTVLLCERRKGRVAHNAGRSNSANFATRVWAVCVSGLLASLFSGNVLLKVLLVAVEVLRAGQRVLEENQDREEHFRGNFHVDSLELFQTDALLLAKNFVEKVLNSFLVLKTIQEHLAVITRKVKLAGYFYRMRLHKSLSFLLLTLHLLLA